MEISEVNPDGNVYQIKDATARNSIATIQNQFGYSTTEQKTNETWINGKPIYKKVINFGALPNNTQKNVTHNISDLDFIVSVEGVAYQPSGSITLPLSNPGTGGSTTQLLVANGSVRVSTNFNATSYTVCYITLMYTKTTD